MDMKFLGQSKNFQKLNHLIEFKCTTFYWVYKRISFKKIAHLHLFILKLFIHLNTNEGKKMVIFIDQILVVTV